MVPLPDDEAVRREVVQWSEQAEEDLRTAHANLRTERFYAAAFFAQQAAEKGLKALYIEVTKDLPPPTHDLLLLAERLDAPLNLHGPLRRLVPEFVKARYPDASGAVPAHLYDARIAEELVGFAEEVMAWTRQRMRK